MSTNKTIIKTIWQHSEPLPEETMEFLRGIAVDCCTVKNDVYKKYSGIKSLDKLTPIYSILNEMRYCGLREQLKLPVVYYELAIADAIADIKSGWGILKNKIGSLITVNENLSADDRIYLRTVLKMNNIYAAILNHQEYEMPRNAEKLCIDTKRLNNLLCRLTRKYLTIPQTDNVDSFKISPNGYSYKNGTLRIVCRVPRKRVSIPLKDNRTFDRQMRIDIKKDSIVLGIPLETKIKKHDDYVNIIYVHIGNKDMLTLSNGNIYGEALDAIVSPETERLNKKNQERRKMLTAYERNTEVGNLKKAENIEDNNLGRVKYDSQKTKKRNRTKDFINSEINRMLTTEKPRKIVITKPVTKNKIKYYSKPVNRSISRSFHGYIRERLLYKCQTNSIELVEINSKGTGTVCSSCGAEGIRQGIEFICTNCGLKTTIPLNSARNIQAKYDRQ